MRCIWESRSIVEPPATTNFIWVVVHGTVYLSGSDYTIHMLKMKCEEMIRYAMISCASANYQDK